MESRECFLSYRNLFYLSIYLSALILFPCRLYAENAAANEAAPVPDAPAAAPIQPTQDKDRPTPKGKPPKDTVTTQSSLMSAEGSAGGNFLSMPALATSLFTGAATMSIPIVTPPGRLNMAPNLALNFNSYGGNGWIGQGWSIDMGAIQRATKFGLKYNTNDFVAIVNGAASELVPRTDWGTNYYGAKIEGSFSKYFYDTTARKWVVTAKNGTKYYYGSYGQYRQDFNLGQDIFKWCLDWVQDTNGNYLTITYTKDQGDIYLEKIEYTGKTGGPLPTSSVKFYLEDGRPDVPLMFTPNYQVKTAKRLKTIEIKANNQMVRAYTFEYVPSASSGRSLLKKVQMYGSDVQLNGSGTVISGTALPPTTIWSDEGRTYSITVENTFTTNDIYSWVSNHWAYGDFNGDGKQDIIYRTTTTNKMRVKFSNGDGSFTDSQNLVDLNDIVQWGPAYLDYGDFNGNGKTDIIYRTNQNQNRIKFSNVDQNGTHTFTDGTPFSTGDLYAVDPKYWAYGDFDGDGKTDIIYHTTTAYTKKIKFSNVDQNGTHTFTDSTYVIYTNDAVDWGPTAWGYGDFNGDGKTDIIYHTNSPYFSRIKFSNGRNTNFTNGPLFYVWDTYGSTYSWGQYWSYGDFNGDGKTDVMYLSVNLPYAWRIKLSNGDGNFTDGSEFFTEDILKKYPDDPEDWAPLYWGTGDFNGDGKTDLIYATTDQPYVGTWRIRFSNGDGTVTDGSFISAGDLYGGYGTPPYWTYGDFDGDGKTDINYLTTPNWRRVRLSRSSLDLPLTVTNGIGGTTSISYLKSSAYQNTLMPFVLQTVSSITTNDGNNNISTTQYGYSGGYYNFPERDFRGFSYVVQTNPDSTKVDTTFLQDNIFKGLISQQRTLDATPQSNVYTQINNEYLFSVPFTGCAPDPYNCAFPYLERTHSYLYDGALQNPNHYLVRFEYDHSNGNLKKKYHYGDDAVVSADDKEENITYTDDTANWIVSLPAYTNIKDNIGSIKAQTWFTYYYGTVNLWTKTDWHWLDGVPKPPDRVTTFTYYSNGNLWKTTDPNLKETTITYGVTGCDPTYTYPCTIAKGGFSTSKTYDLRYGKPLTEKDDNNDATTSYQYDAFGRLTKVTNPNDTGSYYGTQTISYDYFGQGIGTQRIKTFTTEQSGTSNHIWNETYFDGFGRTMTTRTEGPYGNPVMTYTLYNTMGRVSSSSLPYFQYIETAKWVTYTYDALGRVASITTPGTGGAGGGTATRSYDRGKTVLTDANGHVKEEYRDAYGRLKEVDEYVTIDQGPTTATTTYGYNILDNLVQVTDDAGNVTTMGYDSLGRKRSMTDPDMGSWVYEYDGNGNLTSQRDGKGQTIAFEYTDPLNRLKVKNYPTGTDVTYNYDGTASNCYNAGRLTTVSDGSGSTTFCYDKLGRVTKTTKTITGSGSYTTETTYDAMSRTKSIKYPDAEMVYYAYDAGSNLCYVGNSPTGTCQTGGYAKYTNYTALGQPGRVDYGNNAYTTYQYYSQNNRLYSITTNSGGTGRQNLSYAYDNVGNIQTITDILNSNRTQNFQYDELDRLKEAQSNDYPYPLGKITYTYNEIGNMLSNSQVGAYAYPANHVRPHAVSQAGSVTYGYDPNGNMTHKNGNEIAFYDYDNRPTSISGNTFVYDYAGQRVKKNDTIVYIGKLYECTGGACTKHIFAGGQRIALKSGSTVNYYHTDHLGSSSVVTGDAGVLLAELYYYPFGATRTPSALRYKYTGQEEDWETGLYYYGARYYDPAIGRFISADTIVQAPGDPQSLNRYSYVRNNPLIYVDPSGHSWLSDLTGIHIGGDFGDNLWKSDNFRLAAAVAITAVAFYGAGQLIAVVQQAALESAVAAGASLAESVAAVQAAVTPLAAAGIHAGAGALAGGINAGITSGDIGKGMLSGGISAGIANYAGGLLPNGFGYQFAGRTGIGGVTGGITAEIYGGSFSEGFQHGAFTAGMGYLFNHMLHDAYGRLVYHRHGNNAPNWGIEGETGTMTREVPIDGSTAGFFAAMKETAMYYWKALSVSIGAGVTVEAGPRAGYTVYQYMDMIGNLISGKPTSIPKVRIPDLINPPGLY